MEKDLKIQSDEIIRLTAELKRVTKLKDALKSDNFKLISDLESAKEDAGFIVDELDEKDKEIDSLVQTVSEWVALATDRKQDVDQLKAEAKEKDEMIGKLVDEIQGVFGTPNFKLLDLTKL